MYIGFSLLYKDNPQQSQNHHLKNLKTSKPSNPLTGKWLIILFYFRKTLYIRKTRAKTVYSTAPALVYLYHLKTTSRPPQDNLKTTSTTSKPLATYFGALGLHPRKGSMGSPAGILWGVLCGPRRVPSLHEYNCVAQASLIHGQSPLPF